MDHQINPVLQVIYNWPAWAADMALAVRAEWRQTATALDLPPLDESLKWGEPAWRPRKGGTTLRMSWRGDADGLGVYMDCKTDLCARMQSDFPAAFRYAAPRALFLQPDAELPQDALRHLAKMAFRYKRVLPTS
ncbi:hypothetical protein [uncultured Tateyamaria sp.]|uniref:hypothetical protein n=1 Tax=uncultured Tateyamaria sp. TaxID=455651 RepID=UPI002627B897|nr:hypothetical protein [uncultured Tateyamaria sp.]